MGLEVQCSLLTSGRLSLSSASRRLHLLERRRVPLVTPLPLAYEGIMKIQEVPFVRELWSLPRLEENVEA